MLFRLIAILALGLFFSACSPDSSSAPSIPAAEPSVTAPAPATPAVAVPTPNPRATMASATFTPGIPRQGGKLVRISNDPPTLDPHLATDTGSSTFIVEIFGGLVTISRDLEIVPDLAERWEVSDDGVVYTFYLRPYARFHNGRQVTAEDVKWSLERVANPGTLSPVASQYLGDIVGVKEKLEGTATELEGVRVIDDRTVEITIDAPKSYFLAKLSYPTGYVVDQEQVGTGNTDWLRSPNGTGPFKLAEYSIGETIRLVRNDVYHLEPAYLDEVEFVLSGGSAMLMYENDEIHLTGVGLADLDRVRDPSSPLNAQLHQAPPPFRVDYIGLNVEKPPFDDPKVRHALNLAVNRQAIADSVLEGVVSPARGVLPPGFPGFNPNLPPLQYDPELARRTLGESRYGQSMAQFPPVTLSVPGGFGARLPLDLEVIVLAWEDLGIPVEIQQTEFATFLQDLHNGRYDMFYSGWVADYPDPENFLDVLFHSQSENNHTNYHNPEVDTLLERARVEQDRDTRYQLYQQAESLVMKDEPWVILWNMGEGYALIKPEVKDYYLAPIIIPKLRYVYMEQ